MTKAYKPASAGTEASTAIQPTSSGTPWRLPKQPSDPAQTAKAHILANADTPRVMRVCYTSGPDGSLVSIRANKSGGGNVTSNIYLGACIDIGGTDIELINPNAEPVAGTYEPVATEKK